MSPFQGVHVIEPERKKDKRTVPLSSTVLFLDTVAVTLDSTSTWTLTGDSYVTEFNGDTANVISNGFTLYVNGVALTGTK